MPMDESPADVAAPPAAAPVDASSDTAPSMESTTIPGRKRRTSSSRSPRPRKTSSSAASTAIEVEAPLETTPSETPSASAEALAPSAEVVTQEAGEPSARSGRATRRRPARKATRAVAKAEMEPVLEAAEPTEPPAEEKAKKPTTRRRRATRQKAEEVAPPEAMAETAEVETTQAEEETAEDSTAETAVEKKPPIRHRRGRGRKAVEKEGEAEQKATPIVLEAIEAEPPVLPVLEEIEIPQPEEPPARRRRAPRKKAEAVESARGARLATRRGMVEIQIDGQSYPPVLFFGNMDGAKETRRVASEVQRAAKAGVHLHSTLIELPCPLLPEDSVYEMVDHRLQTLLEADPQGYVMPRIVFVPARGWRSQYPNDVIQYADGSTGDPSIASMRFWQEAENALAALIDHIRRTAYGDRVFGYHLERGEWFHPADRGYDRSFVNREAFREWLRAKYKKSVVALRAAWFDGNVQFHTAEIPMLPTIVRPEMAFFEARKERRYIDFLEFTSDITAERLISLAKAVKEATENRALVSVCYGYTLEFCHTYSGHLALDRLLASPAIDLIAGPPSYRDRQAGGAGSYPAPVDSMALHGKLWLSEDDTKTFLAPDSGEPDDYNPRVDTRTATEQVHLRAMGNAMAHQCALAFMDLWGEGWLDSEEIWSRIGAFTARYRDFMKLRRATSPEVIALIDERSLLHVQKGEGFLRRLLHGQRDILLRCGASVGIYLQSDLTHRNFPTDAKLYLFLTPYRLTTDQRAAIREKLQSDGKTLVWVYAVGTCDERGHSEESANDLIGMALQLQSWNCEVGSRFVNLRHPIAERLQNKELGVRERLNPSFYVDEDEPGTVVLAEYLQTGLPSVAVREMSGWRSVFCGEPTLSADLLRGLCRYAGVHLYTDNAEDYLFASNGWVTLHTTGDGQRILRFPPHEAVYDLSGGKLLGEEIREYRAFMRGRSTHSFFVGSLEEMRKLSLPGVEKRRRKRRDEAEAPAATVVEEIATRDGVSEVGEEVLAEVDVALHEYEEARAEALADEAEEAELVVVEAPERRRRRRRRGGRGRGRGRRGGSSPGANGAGEAPPAGE